MTEHKILCAGREIPVYALDTVVIGTGCAGYNAADSLFNLGRTDVAIITEGVKMGTSRNTGSDKQTYYKLSCVPMLRIPCRKWQKRCSMAEVYTAIRRWRKPPGLCAAL